MENINNTKEVVREKLKESSHTIWSKSATYILAGLGFVVGLAWNDAIQYLVKFVFPIDTGGGLSVKFIYAVIVTILLVFVAGKIGKYSEK